MGDFQVGAFFARFNGNYRDLLKPSDFPATTASSYILALITGLGLR